MRIDRVLGMKCERYETVEPARLVLQIAQLNEVINAFFQRLDVTIQHGRIRPDAQLVNGTGNFQPTVAGNLMSCNQRPGTFCKNFSSAARTTSHTGIPQLGDDPFERLARNLREKVELDHRECLEMHQWKPMLQAA